MAIINKTGITNGGTVQAEHVTRAIDALSGVSTDSIVATGSLQGTASFAVTASYAMNGGGGSSVTASYALTASKIQVSDSTSTTGAMPILLSNGTAGATRLVISDQTDFSFNPIANLLTVAKISSTTIPGAAVDMSASFASSASVAIKIPVISAPQTPTAGAIFFDAQDPLLLWVYNGTDWVSFLGAIGTP